MSIDNTFAIKKLQKADGFYVLFSPLTKMPYVCCDPETFDDQIYMFSSEELAKAFAEPLTEQKIPTSILKIPQPQMPGFWNSLYALDVNMTVYTDEAGVSRISVEELIKKPDIKKLMEDKIPVINPSIMLTSLYFLQELRRQVPHDMPALHDLEDEMIANLVKGHFILAIESATDPTGQNEEQVDLKNIRIPFLKTKDGDIYQPLYSDLAEFRKGAGPNATHMRLSNLTFKQLPQFLIKESKGYVLNPGGFNLVLTSEQIKRIISECEPEVTPVPVQLVPPTAENTAAEPAPAESDAADKQE